MMYTTHRVALLGVLLLLLACGPAQGRTVKHQLELTPRSVSVTGKLNIKMVETATKKLLEHDSVSQEPIVLRINAHGDAIEAAFALVDVARSLRSPVIALVESRAYDAGAIVALLCEKTLVFPNAVLALRPVTKVSGEIKLEKDHLPDAAFLARFRDRVYAELARALKMSPADYAKKVEKSWWMTADEAVAAGAADAIVEGLHYREIYIEQTEVKRTIKTVEEKHVPAGDK